MPTTAPQAARKHYLWSALLAKRAISEARKAKPRGMLAVAQVVATHQVVAATRAPDAVQQMLTEQAIDEAAQALLTSTAFTTSADSFAAMAEQLANDYEFDRLVSSLVQDAGRTAESVSVAITPRIGYVRYLNPPSCSRCAVLAGRVYRYSTGFQRHPNCFPAGTIVSGPAAHGASRRWYEGKLFVIRTASGKELTATANHPVLTNQGWLPANLLAEGGYVISRSAGERSSALLVPNQNQMPARIEDVWSADGMSPLGRMPVAAEDFHGDGLGSSEVDVVLSDRLVRDRDQVALFKHLREQALTLGVKAALSFDSASSGFQFGGCALPGLGGRLGGFDLGGTLGGLHLGGAQQSRLGWTPNDHASLLEATPDDYAVDPSAERERVFALAANIGLNKSRVVNGEPSHARWDAPAVPFSLENRGAYASQGLDLRNRLAGDVQLDRIVELRAVSFSGHVYNLTSSEGWYDANGIIVSNCDCTMIPTAIANDQYVHDPVELMKAGQVTDLPKADRQAILDGADFSRVVNARLRNGGVRDSGLVLARVGRPTPAAIYRAATSREEAIQRLISAGYIRS